MMKRKATHHYCPLYLSLAVWLLAAALPASGQVIEPGASYGLSVGTCFNSESSSQSCRMAQLEFRWYRQPRDQVKLRPYQGFASSSLMQPRRGSELTAFGVGGTATVLTDTWPDKDPPDDGDPSLAPTFSSKQSKVADDHEPPQVKHRGTFTFTVEAFLPIPADPRFLLEPFVGMGLGYVREDESRRPDQSTVTDQTFFVATYGMNLVIRKIRRNLDLRIQYRGFIFYPDNPVKYVAPDGSPFEVELGTVNNSSLLVGFGIRL